MNSDGSDSPASLVRITPLIDALAYAPLTYPAYGALLAAAAEGKLAVAVGAAVAEQPVGLALAELRAETAEVVSLFVAAEHRRRGLGARLLAAIELELRAAGCCSATLVYTAGKRPTEAAERLLAAQGWTPPSPRMQLVTLGTASLAQVPAAPWFRPLQLPKGASVFPWTQLPPTERDELLARQRDNPWFPEFLSPFREPDRVDDRTSLGLRRDGELVGWMVTHRLDPRTLRYTSLFVRSDVPWPRIGWQLLVEAIRRQLEHASKDERATLGIMASSRFWPVIQKRLLPFVAIESHSTTMESRKSF